MLCCGRVHGSDKKIGTAIAKLQRPLLRQTNQGTPWEGFGHEPRARVALIDVRSPVQSARPRARVASRRSGWLVPYSGGAWGSLCQALSGPFLAAASISLQCQHTAGTDHQPPNFVGAELNLVTLRRLARSLIEYLYLPGGRSSIGPSGFLAPVPAATLMVLLLNVIVAAASLMFPNRTFAWPGFGMMPALATAPGSSHYKTYAGGVVLAAKLEHRRAIRGGVRNGCVFRP